MNIAIIDDQSTITKLYEIMLRANGAIQQEDKVLIFNSANAFLSSESNVAEFDIIVCDHHLGRESMQGLSLLRKCNHKQDATLILLTGDDSEGMKYRMENSPHIHYILKGGKSIANNTYVALYAIFTKSRLKLGSENKK